MSLHTSFDFFRWGKVFSILLATPPTFLIPLSSGDYLPLVKRYYIVRNFFRSMQGYTRLSAVAWARPADPECEPVTECLSAQTQICVPSPEAGFYTCSFNNLIAFPPSTA